LDEETVYVILRCEEIQLGKVEPLDKVRNDIERVINVRKSKASVDEWLDRVRKKAVIKKFI
jgi:hypothetical protein